jgi:hypothetical protein
MAVYDTVTEFGIYREYLGDDGTNDEDVCIETTDVSKYNTFMLSNTAGAVKVLVNDGQQWQTAPLSLADLGATDTNPVLLTAADRQYGFRGFYKAIRVLQEGATAATGVVLRCANN